MLLDAAHAWAGTEKGYSRMCHVEMLLSVQHNQCMQGVGRIYAIKHRQAHVPLAICVADVADVIR